MVDLLAQHHEHGRRFEPSEFIEQGSRVAVRLKVSDPRWHGETAETFKVFTFREPDGEAVRLQDCSGRDDALAYLDDQQWGCCPRDDAPARAEAVIEQLHAATEALGNGDLEPFVALLAEDCEWRGQVRGHLWWKRAPSWRGPEEAREVFQILIHKSGAGRLDLEPEFVEVGADRLIGSTSWLGRDGTRHARYQVLTIRDDKIVEMQDCGSRQQAERFARRG